MSFVVIVGLEFKFSVFKQVANLYQMAFYPFAIIVNFLFTDQNLPTFAMISANQCFVEYQEFKVVSSFEIP